MHFKFIPAYTGINAYHVTNNRLCMLFWLFLEHRRLYTVYPTACETTSTDVYSNVKVCRGHLNKYLMAVVHPVFSSRTDQMPSAQQCGIQAQQTKTHRDHNGAIFPCIDEIEQIREHADYKIMFSIGFCRI